VMFIFGYTMAYVVVARTKAMFVVCNLDFGNEIATYDFLQQKLLFCCVCGPLLFTGFVEFVWGFTEFVSMSFVPRLKSHAGTSSSKRTSEFEMVKFFEAECLYKLFFSCDCVNGCNSKTGPLLFKDTISGKYYRVL